MGEPEDCNETYFTYRSSGQRAEIAMDGRCPIGPMSGLAGNGPAPSESPPPILRSPQLFLEGTSYGNLPRCDTYHRRATNVAATYVNTTKVARGSLEAAVDARQDVSYARSP